jgi:hypothetical protein
MTDLVYTPPGIYIQEQATPVPNISNVVALPPSRVALVGPSVGYQSKTETVTVGAGAVSLTETGIDSATIVVTSLDQVVYTSPTDYTVAQAGAVAEEATTTIARVGGGGIPLNSVVYVTYRYTNTSFYQPYFTTDWDEIQSRYGAAINTDGSIGSPLSLAAKIVMEQGAREIILVPTKGSSTTLVSAAQLSAALLMLAAREDVGIVVSLPVGIAGTDNSPGETTQVCTDLRSSVTNAVTDGKYRIGIIGMDKTAVRSHDQLAAAISSERMMLAYPNVMNWYNGYTNLVMELSGYYLAAACAGKLASQQSQVPLTKKLIASFASIPARIFNIMTVAYKNNLSGHGVAVTEQLADGRLVVRHGVSTLMTNVLTREVSITRAKDTLLRLVGQALDRSGVVGEAMTVDSPVHIRSIVEGALSQAQQIGTIVDYSNLAVRQSQAEPTTLEVKFAYTPAYPLNKITVSFSINVVTGTIQGA